MLDQILTDCKHELINGYAKRKHPFRYFTLATSDSNGIRQRTVVLRKLQDDFTILFYTDARTPKVQSIQENSNVSALFYHPKKLLQIQITGQARIVEDSNRLKQYWNNIGEHSRKDYITKLVPGSEIKNPDHVGYNPEDHHFCAIEINPTTIEYLQLKRPNHLRPRFHKDEKGECSGQFLTP